MGSVRESSETDFQDCGYWNLLFPFYLALKIGVLNGWAEEPVSGMVWVWEFHQWVSQLSGLRPLPMLWSSVIIAIGWGRAPTTPLLISGLISFHQRQQIQTGYLDLGWSPRNLAKYYSNSRSLPGPSRMWDMAGTGLAHTRLLGEVFLQLECSGWKQPVSGLNLAACEIELLASFLDTATLGAGFILATCWTRF